MTTQGIVLEVSILPGGNMITAALTAGTTIIPVGDASSFSEGGGQVMIGGVVYTYSTKVVEDDTLLLTTGLGAAVGEGIWALVHPPSEEKWALIQQSIEGDDMLRARVPHSLADRLPDGIREESEQESVLITMQYTNWVITDIIALAPMIDVEYLVGDVPPDFTSDNLPPGLSPTPIAVGGVGSIFLTWAGILNNDPVTYEVYGSSSAGFVKDSTTFLGQVSGTSMNVRAMNAGVALVQETNYYFAIVAKDIDGAAPASAESNAAQMVKITNEMIAANYVYAGIVFASQIRGGLMTADIAIAGSFKTAESGQRTVIDGAGQRFYGPDGTSVMIDLPNFGMPKFSGIINAFGMVVNDGLELRGQNNTFAMSSITTLQSTTQGSTTPPTLTVDYEQVDSQMTTYLYNLRGYHREADGALPTFTQSFFGYSRMGHNGKAYVWPQITDGNGSLRSTRGIHFGAPVRTALGASRWVTYGEHWVAGATSPVPAFEVLNQATMTADNIAPASLGVVPWGTSSFYTGYAMGRCFSLAGSSDLEADFAMVKYDLAGVDQMTLIRWRVTDSSVIQQDSVVVASPLPDNPDDGVRGVVYGSSAKMGFPNLSYTNIWVVFTKSKAYVWNSTGTTRILEYEFDLNPDTGSVDAVGSTAAGVNSFVRFEGTPYYNETSLLSTRYTNIHWSNSSSPVWWLGYTWADSDVAGTAITAETNVSVLASVTMKKRARLVVTVPDLPDPAAGMGQPRGVDDVNRFNVYMQRQATAPARTALWKQNVQPSNLVSTAVYDLMPVFLGTTNPPASTTFSSQAAAKLQSSAVGADGLPKMLLDGNGLMHGETLDISGDGATSLQGKAFQQLYYGIRAQARMSGGGQLTVASTWHVKWSERFLITAMGKSVNVAPDGYFSIYTPNTGNTIPGYGGATTKTATADGVPLNAWDALWYELPYAEGSDTQFDGFRVTNYTTDFVVPNNWVMICVRNVDGNDKVDWATGPKLAAGGDYYTPIDWTPLTLANGWLAYGSPFQPLEYRRSTEGRIYLRGLIKSGATGSVSVALPVGCRPAYQKVNAAWANAGMARVDVKTTGLIDIIAYYGGSNGFVSFDGINFDVNG